MSLASRLRSHLTRPRANFRQRREHQRPVESGKYVFKKSDKSEHSPEQMVRYWSDWVRKYPDRVDRRWAGGRRLARLVADEQRAGRQDPAGRRRPVCHQSLSGCNEESTKGVANSILIKLNQIGTVSETLDAIELASATDINRSLRTAPARPKTLLSRISPWRTHAGQIKTGSASRTDRVAKYNQLLRIEEELGSGARFLGIKALNYKGELAGRVTA